MGSVEMRSTEEKVDLNLDEDIPFNSSHSTSKMQSRNLETARITSPRYLSHQWLLRKMKQISPLRSVYIVLIKAKINMLLPFGPLAILLNYLTGKHGWVFFFSLLGISPLAERLGYATEFHFV